MVLKSNLYELRTERGLSLPQLAQLSGVSVATLNHIENDVSDPRLSTVVAIAWALDVDINQMFRIEKL